MDIKFRIDEMLKKISYCTFGNSKFQDEMLLREAKIPEQQMKVALINWHAVVGALVEYYYKELEHRVDIELTKLEISFLREEIDKRFYDEQKKQCKIKKLELKLERQELERELNRPLVEDSMDRLNYLESRVKSIEKNNLEDFERGSEKYHRLRVEESLRADKLSRILGVERSTLEYADRVGNINISEVLNSNSLNTVIGDSSFSLSNPLNDYLLSSIKTKSISFKKNWMIGIPQRNKGDRVATLLNDGYINMPHGSVFERKFVFGKNYVNARNYLVNYALQNDIEWILFLDDDILMPNNAPIILYDSCIKNNIDVISGFYYRKQKEKIANWTHIENGVATVPKIEEGKILECNWLIPTGCMLINTRVFSKLEKPYFNMLVEENGKVSVGEDCYFTIKLNKSGIKTYIHGDVKCGHVDFESDLVYWGDKIDSYSSYKVLGDGCV